ncbi:neural Wiskott-Aldrich syndrome protein-like [Sarcophilus harrisii]|uniref:neural Wiskott-Aldrich syndrome protein-like n=1 Tax=Sarcophilus harrisii TaxID=9305 RepID=UPI000C7DB47D|nr:neural Wiskott-Aldrich syndrome protein-like [Sarcophilus harrisii]
MPCWGLPWLPRHSLGPSCAPPSPPPFPGLPGAGSSFLKDQEGLGVAVSGAERRKTHGRPRKAEASRESAFDGLQLRRVPPPPHARAASVRLRFSSWPIGSPCAPQARKAERLIPHPPPTSSAFDPLDVMAPRSLGKRSSAPAPPPPPPCLPTPPPPHGDLGKEDNSSPAPRGSKPAQRFRGKVT